MSYKEGSTNVGTITQYDVLVGGSGSAIASVGPGSSGQILQSGGNAANPAYSTATYPATAGSNGNVLTSNGTNFVSQALPGVTMYSVTVPLTNANIKALNSTAITIVGAQGSGIVIIPITATLKLIYGGSNVFSSSGVSTCICYGTTAATNKIFQSNSATFWAASGNEYFTPLNSTASATFNFAYTAIENAAVSISTTAAITGNAANDNTGEVNMLYYLISI